MKKPRKGRTKLAELGEMFPGVIREAIKKLDGATAHENVEFAKKVVQESCEILREGLTKERLAGLRAKEILEEYKRYYSVANPEHAGTNTKAPPVLLPLPHPDELIKPGEGESSPLEGTPDPEQDAGPDGQQEDQESKPEPVSN